MSSCLALRAAGMPAGAAAAAAAEAATTGASCCWPMAGRGAESSFALGAAGQQPQGIKNRERLLT